MSALKSIYHERPIGKFIALFNDGSGATIFYRDDEGNIYDMENYLRTDEALIENYSEWIQLPDNFKLFCEANEAAEG